MKDDDSVLIISTTEIKKRGQKPALTEIVLEDGRLFQILQDIAQAYFLRENERVKENNLQDAIRQSDQERVKEAALRLLSIRLRSQKELFRSLRQRKFSAESSQWAVEKMRELGYLNDAHFANQYTEELITRKKSGKRMIKMQLQQRGIEKETADEAITSQYSEEKELENALSLAEKWNRRSKPIDPQQRRKAAFQYLIYRGFSYEIARKAIESALGRTTDEA